MMLWEKPDDRDGGAADEGDADDTGDQDDGAEEDEEEFPTEFEAKLAKDHPELLDAYRDATSGLHSALRKEREKGRGKSKVEKELQTYKDKEAEAERERRTREENLEADLATATKRAEEAEARFQELHKKSVVQTVAAELNFRDPTDVIGFVDMGSLEIGEDDSETTKAVKTELTQLAKTKPYLLKKNLGESGNDTDNDTRRKLDKDPKKKAEVKAKQPKLAI